MVVFSTIGRVQEGISDLEVIKDKRDINVCSLLALTHAHRLCKTVGMYTWSITLDVNSVDM